MTQAIAVVEANPADWKTQHKQNPREWDVPVGEGTEHSHSLVTDDLCTDKNAYEHLCTHLIFSTVVSSLTRCLTKN